MSTTLIPPTQYAVRRPGEPFQIFTTLQDAATAVIRCGPLTPSVFALTGVRRRNLGVGELQQLAAEVRRQRIPARSPFGGQRRAWA